jgi:dynamin 1-like protein
METEVISKNKDLLDPRLIPPFFFLIELLIQSYYNIVKRTMIDMVPKAIMLNLVSRAKKELQQELLTELYKADVLDELLEESEFTQQRRKECKKMIEALQKADEIVGSV